MAQVQSLHGMLLSQHGVRACWLPNNRTFCSCSLCNKLRVSRSQMMISAGQHHMQNHQELATQTMHGESTWWPTKCRTFLHYTKSDRLQQVQCVALWLGYSCAQTGRQLRQLKRCC